jgi:hypothetical protein
MNHGHGMSDAAYDSVHGTHRIRTGPSEVAIDGEHAVSQFVRTNRMKHVLQDEFDTVRGNKNYYVGGDFTIRVDGRFNIIAGNTDKKREYQKAWMDATAELAAAKAAGEVKRGFEPIGQPGNTEQKSGAAARNPLLDSTYPTTNSESEGLQGTGTVTAKRKDTSVETGAWGQAKGDTPAESPSTEGGEFEANEVDLQELRVQTQEALTEIERNMPRNEIPLIADNLIIATSGPPNTRPPGRKDPVGRSERKGVKLFEKGPATEYVGVPHYEEVDNYSDVPFGNIILKAGNNMTLEVGNGGINMVTGGNIKFVGGANTIIGGEQVIVAGKGNVRIKGKAHVSIEGDNIDFKSGGPITMDNLNVSNGVVVGGGMYVNGELFVNHITAPREWQKTNIEPEITYAKARSGMKIGQVTITGGSSSGTYDVVGTGAATDSVQVNSHIHWFENVPLTLAGSNKAARNSAASLNNGGVVAATPPTDR